MSNPESGKTSSHRSDAPLKSSLANDPDMVELVEFFVEEMDERIEMIQSAADNNDLGELRVVAHQLKGAGAGYGFAPISKTAAELEQKIDAAGPSQGVESVREQVDELISLCRRASV